MKKWKKTEKECYEYIKSAYSGIVNVIPYGESDSTHEDIQIEKKNGNSFFIEVKCDKSQCCQFVLFPDEENEKFDESERSRGTQSVNKSKIISYMNDNFEKYKKVGKKGIDSPVEKEILYGMVRDFYKAKKVEFFMTKGVDYIVIPVEKFSEYFEISATYRKKGSGSTEVTKMNYAELSEELKNKQIDGTLDFQIVEKKLRCFLHSSNSLLNQKRIEGMKYTYLIENNEYSKEALILTSYSYIYEVRRLSNLYNPNVICQLKLKKKDQDKNDINCFENAIKREI